MIPTGKRWLAGSLHSQEAGLSSVQAAEFRAWVVDTVSHAAGSFLHPPG